MIVAHLLQKGAVLRLGRVEVRLGVDERRVRAGLRQLPRGHAAPLERPVLAVLPAPPPELRETRRHGLRERRRRLDDPEIPRAVRELPAPVERVRGVHESRAHGAERLGVPRGPPQGIQRVAFIRNGLQ